MVTVYYNERIQIEIIHGRDSQDRVQESSTHGASSHPLPGELQTALNSLATICDKIHGVLPAR